MKTKQQKKTGEVADIYYVSDSLKIPKFLSL